MRETNVMRADGMSNIHVLKKASLKCMMACVHTTSYILEGLREPNYLFLSETVLKKSFWPKESAIALWIEGMEVWEALPLTLPPFLLSLCETSTLASIFPS